MGGFCTHCSHRVASFDGLSQCPNCGSTGKPCSDENQVNVSVNTHELRVLCIWAENWALQHRESDPNMAEVVYAIALRLRRQLGAKDVSLTMADEFTELKKALGASGATMETNHPAGDQP